MRITCRRLNSCGSIRDIRQLALILHNRLWQEEEHDDRRDGNKNEKDPGLRHDGSFAIRLFAVRPDRGEVARGNKGNLGARLQKHLLLSELFHLIAVLDFIDKYLGRLEAWDKVFIDDDCGIARDITRNFFLSLFIDKAAKSANINIMTARHGVLYDGEEGFNRRSDIGFVNARLVCNLVDNVCFRHVAGCLKAWFKVGKSIWAARK
jgi:hypothetical protein